MPDKFDKFSTEARAVFARAHEEARSFNHNYIGTEHLLLGLLRVEGSHADRALDSLGVRLPAVRSAVESIIGYGDSLVVGDPGLTPHAKRVIELALDEARNLRSSPGNQIGTEHLLLGIVRAGEGYAAQILQSLGVNLERVQRAVLVALTEADQTRATRFPYGGTIINVDQEQFVYGLVLPVEMLTKLTDLARKTNRPMGDLIRDAIALYLLPPSDADNSEGELPPPQNDPPVQP